MDYKAQLNEYILIWEFFNNNKIDTEKLELINYREGFNPYKHDWNYLIQLILKIRELGNNVEIGYKETIISDLYEDYTITKSIANTSIEAAYNACIQFIKYYNENIMESQLLKLGWDLVNGHLSIDVSMYSKLVYSNNNLFIINTIDNQTVVLLKNPTLEQIKVVVIALNQQ